MKAAHAKHCGPLDIIYIILSDAQWEIVVCCFIGKQLMVWRKGLTLTFCGWLVSLLKVFFTLEPKFCSIATNYAPPFLLNSAVQK